MAEASVATRSATVGPLIGQNRPDVPSGGLPTEEQVLQVIAHIRDNSKNKNQSVLSFCCTENHHRDAVCLQEGGCGERDTPCLLLLVKLPWLKAGIVTVCDSSIKKKLVESNSQYTMMKKHRNRTTPVAEQKRKEYAIQLHKTWDIKSQNARSLIENDPIRSAAAKKEDLSFFDDYLGPNASRKWSIGKRDTGYDREQLSSLLSAEALENRRQERKKKEDARVEKERKRKQDALDDRGAREERTEGQDVLDDVGEQGEQEGQQEGEQEREGAKGQKRVESDKEDRDWGEGSKGAKKHKSSRKVQKSSRNMRRRDKGSSDDGGEGGDDEDEDDDDGVWLKVPRKILKLTALTAARRLLSLDDHVSILASFIVASGGDLDDFLISHSSSYKLRKEAMEEVYRTSRETFKEKALAEDWPLTLHLDEKALGDSIGPHGARTRVLKSRLAVTLTCPLYDGEFFVCAPVLENQSGRAVADAALHGVMELGVLDKICSVSYDTTASNSSPAVGSAALVEQERGCLILKMPCRHHHIDLFGKNISPVVSGRQSQGPADPLFKRYAREWPNIFLNIDYTNLKKFNIQPYLGTFLYDMFVEVRNWARHAVTTMTFSRGTHRNLLYLIVVYLDAEPEGFNFKFHKPEDIDNARFGQRVNIYLTIELLSRQLPFLTPGDLTEVTNMALICSLFCGPDFLKSPLLSRASFNDLTSIKRYRQLYKFMPEGNCLKEAARVALNTWQRHLDFLTAPHITWSLTNDDFSTEERQTLADSLLARLDERVLDLPPSRVQYPGPNYPWNEIFWPVDGSLPPLDQFVTVESFLVFNQLQVSNQDLRDLLQVPVTLWSIDRNSPNFQPHLYSLHFYATQLEATNDPAERALKLVKDTVGKYNTEDNFQHGLVTVVEERKLAKAGKNGHISKENLKGIVRPRHIGN